MRPVRWSIRLLLATAIFCFIASASHAQVPDPVAAAQVPIPGAGHHYIGIGAETVNPADGSLSFDLPLQPAPGRQLSFPFGIHYNASERFSPSGTGPGVNWVLFPAPPFQLNGWNYQLPVYTAQVYQAPYGLNPQQQTTYCDHTQNYIFRGFDGIQRNLSLKANWPDGGNNQFNCNPTTSMSAPAYGFISQTPSNYAGWPVHPPLTVSDASGTNYFFPSVLLAPSGTPTPWGLFAQTITDRNGNQITFTGTSNSGTSGSYKDTLGRTVVSWSGIGSSSGDQLAITGLGGNVVVHWTTITESFPESGHDVSDNGVARPCSMTPNQSSPQSIAAVSEIDIPGNPTQRYFFSYDPTYARPNKITFPGGGYVRYVWGLNTSSAASSETWPVSAGGNATCDLVYDTAVITDRYVSYDGGGEVLHQHFDYTTTWGLYNNPALWSAKTTKVTSTDLVTGQGSVTTYHYLPDLVAQVPVEGQIVYQDGSGKTLKTVNKSWLSVFHILGEQTILDNGQGKATLRCYNSGYQVSDVYEYGFQGEGSYPGDPSCLSGIGLNSGFNTSAVGPIRRHTAVAYHAFLNTNILDEPDTVTLYDGSGNQIKQSSFVYDGSSLVPSGAPNLVTPPGLRGNLSSATRWLNTGTSPTTTYAYYDSGQVQRITDPCGNTNCSDMSGSNHTTSYSYNDTYSSCSGTAPPVGGTNAYLTKITDPLGHTQSLCYGYNDGQLRSLIDQNGQPTTYKYADVLARLTETDFPDQGQSTISYNDSPSSPTKTWSSKVNTTPLYMTDVTTMDGLGHVVQTALTTDPDGATYTPTRYNGFGAPYQIFNATRCTPPTTNNCESTWGFSTTLYDALGRVTQVTEQDGQIVMYSYNGNCTTVTDEAGKARTSCTDGLGRLTQVIEDPGGLGYVTTYSYDALDNLTGVLQNGSRQRTFTYDSLSRLLTATNPESGTSSFTYDANGNLATKTSPAPNQTGSAMVTISYCHDAVNRLTSKAYAVQSCPMSTPVATYSYDQTSFNGLTVTNGIGRRTGMTDQAGSEAWSYDSMGRISADLRTTAGFSKTILYTYNLDGSLATLSAPTYPDGSHPINLTYVQGGAGRPLSVTSGYPGFINNAHYTPAGAQCYLQGNWDGTFTTTTIFNNRLQPLHIQADQQQGSGFTPPPVCGIGPILHTTTQQTFLDLSYSYLDAANHNNGNVVTETNNLSFEDVKSYTYDSLNRIATAQTSDNNQPDWNGDTSYLNECWAEQYSYDPWGNLLSIAPSSSPNYIGCVQESGFNFTGFVNAKNQIAASGYAYDAAGNIIVAPPTGTTYTYDAENHLVSTGGVTYTYDGDGRRVTKSTGTIYSYLPSGDVLMESALSNGYEQFFYFFFNGKRVGNSNNLNATNEVAWYFTDPLGSTRFYWQWDGDGGWNRSDYYPFGGERVIQSDEPSHFKFTGKERDTESSNDNFGARYYSSSLGRFLSPDWSSAPMGVPYAEFDNPQSLNLYSYVKNNPVNVVDPDGHDQMIFQGGSDLSPLDPRVKQAPLSRVEKAVLGVGQIALGLYILATTGDLPAAEALMISGTGGGLMAHGGADVAGAVGNASDEKMSDVHEGINAATSAVGIAVTVATKGDASAGAAAAAVTDVASAARHPSKLLESPGDAVSTAQSAKDAPGAITRLLNFFRSPTPPPPPPPPPPTCAADQKKPCK